MQRRNQLTKIQAIRKAYDDGILTADEFALKTSQTLDSKDAV